MNNKKIFSANKVSWLLINNCKPIQIGVSEDTGKVYYSFPENEKVNNLINKYKNPNDYNSWLIFKFLRTYKKVRDKMTEVKSNAC
ncbi:DUF5659 domain-containing protein [Clostridium thermosuccinogenes]|uniref:DUF5659 domain-containing protein n=1 Tax=Clostridium thermosuccinogenes TaxID=84032 RepID=UPI000CCC4135|nr:DUF5659 domain-containing protein [Pseudoclostridium thermosuccinogenes]PNT94160.1 hypothetical protein CDQ83_11975 [Pseudoclostridium thermosuccinogenes]